MTVGARPLRRDAAVVVGVVCLLALPHLLLGPQITADDWVWVRNGEFLGWWDAGGSRQVGRPGAFALYALTFGLGGPHPLVHALVQVLLWAAAAVAVLAALREVVDHRIAFAVVVVWLLAPSHTTLELWASTSQAWVAILCLALGSRQVAQAARGEGSTWPALLLLGAAGAFYEVAILAAPVAAAIVDRVVAGAWRWRPALLVGAACVPALAWSVATATVYTDEVGLPTTESYWIEHLAGSVGLGLPVDRRAVAAAAVVVWLVALLLLRRARPTSPELAMAAAGSALVVAGTAAALRAYTIPFGMGDRLTAVSGVGAAIVAVAVARALPLTPRVGTVAAVVLAGVALAARLPMLTTWDDVGDRAASEVRALAAEPAPIVVDGPLVSERLAYGLSDGWNATAAVQVATGDPARVVQVDIGCARSGPPVDEPLQQYGTEAGLRVPGCDR